MVRADSSPDIIPLSFYQTLRTAGRSCEKLILFADGIIKLMNQSLFLNVYKHPADRFSLVGFVFSAVF